MEVFFVILIIILFLIRSFVRGLNRFILRRNKKKYILSCIIIGGVNLVLIIILDRLNYSFNDTIWFFLVLAIISHIYLESID